MEVGPVSGAAQSVVTGNMHDGQLLPGGHAQRLGAKYVAANGDTWVKNDLPGDGCP